VRSSLLVHWTGKDICTDRKNLSDSQERLPSEGQEHPAGRILDDTSEGAANWCDPGIGYYL
jgi:hypothetical protein